MIRSKSLTGLLAGVAALLLLPGASATADVASDLHEELKERWYTTEIVVFRYDAAVSSESLLHDGERRRAGETRDEFAESEPMADQLPDNTMPGATTATKNSRTVTDQQLERPALDVEPLEDIADSMSGGDLRQLVMQNLSTWENQLRERDGLQLPEDQLTLSEQVQKLSNSRNLSVLLHQAWTQAVPPRANGKPIAVSAGDTFVDPRSGSMRQRLEGEVTVTLGRYLHLQPTLFYTPESALDAFPQTSSAPGGSTLPATNPADSSRRGPAVRDLSQSQSLDGLSAMDRLAARSRMAQENGASTLAGGRIGTGARDFEAELPPYIRMDQSRRLRSGELHYIDHPELGVLVRITPVVAPDALQEQFALLQ